VVGKDETEHFVPKDLLLDASTVFEQEYDCFEGDLLLEHTTVNAFRIFLGWLLNGNVLEDRQASLAEAWIFAASFKLPKLQNEIMRSLCSRLERCNVLPAAVSIAYQTPEVARQLRKVFVAHIAHDVVASDDYNWDAEAVAECDLDDAMELTLDIMLAMKQAAAASGEVEDGVSVEHFLVDES